MSYSIRSIYLFFTSKCGSVNCGNILCVFIFFTVLTNVWLCRRNYELT